LSNLYCDTDPKIEKLQIEIIRSMPAWKKISIVDSLNQTLKTLMISGIKERNPSASPQQVQYNLAELLLGEELARKVYDHAR